MSASRQVHWTNVAFLVGFPLLFLAWMPFQLTRAGLRWEILLFTLFYYSVTALAITGGYHRLFAHRTYEARPWLRAVILFFGAGAFQNSALKWSMDHRIHHTRVDTDGDPYNIKRGFFWAHMGWIFFADQKEVEPDKIPKDLRDPLVLWQHRHYLPVAVLSCLGVPAVFGWLIGDLEGGLLWGGIFRVIATSHCTYLINSASHYFGSQPYTDHNTARDNALLAFLTFGEGYHNYHHIFEFDYRNGIRWYQWDPTKWLIGTGAWLGLTWNLKRAPERLILSAKLQKAELDLKLKGANIETLSALRKRIEASQKRLTELKAEWKHARDLRSDEAKELLEQLRHRIQEAKIEFQFEYRSWRISWARQLALVSLREISP